MTNILAGTRMPYDPLTHHRRSIRLKGYNYAQEGTYFVTICTHDRECVLGEIRDGAMVLDGVGEIAWQCWDEIPDHFRNVELGEYVMMPNHLHGIILLQEIPHGDDVIRGDEVIRRDEVTSSLRDVGRTGNQQLTIKSE